MITIQKILKTLVWSFLLIMLLSTFLFAEESKDLPPAPPEILKGCDQSQPQNSPSDTSISSSTPSSKEKTADPKSIIPAPSKIQEDTSTGG